MKYSSICNEELKTSKKKKIDNSKHLFLKNTFLHDLK